MNKVLNNEQYKKYHLDSFELMFRKDFPNDTINIIFSDVQIFKGINGFRFNNINRNCSFLQTLVKKYNIFVMDYERCFSIDLDRSNLDDVIHFCDEVLERDVNAYKEFKKQKKELELYRTNKIVELKHINLPEKIENDTIKKIDEYIDIYIRYNNNPKPKYTKIIKKINKIKDPN